MTQSNERDKYAFLTDEERTRLGRIEKVNDLSLDELQVGDRLGVVGRDGRFDERHGEVFILDVVSREQLEQDANGRIKVTFRYSPGILGFAFYDEQGKTLALEPGTTLESGFSSISTHTMPNHPPFEPDYNRIKTGETYWFRNAGGIGQVAIARDVRDIGLLRKV